MLKALSECFFILAILFLGQTAFPADNSTLFSPSYSLDYDSPEYIEADNSAGYSLHNFPKKPPHDHSIFPELHKSFWLVSVLRYLVSVSGNSLELQEPPIVTLLPVALVTASNWWLHEQQVLDLMHDRNETVVGDPIFIAEATDGGGDDKKADRTHSATDAARQEISNQESLSSKASSPNSESNGRDDRNDGGIIHQCGSQSCPACHFAPCHCQKCSMAVEPVAENPEIDSAATPVTRKNKRENQASEEEPLEKKSKIEDEHDATTVVRSSHSSVITNIVLLLRQREVTGQLHARNNPVLAQAALDVRGPSTPELEFIAHSSNGRTISVHYERWQRERRCHCQQGSIKICIKAVIPLENGDLLSWAEDGVKIWSLQSGVYTSDEVPTPPCEIKQVFVIQNDHIVIWLENGMLLERKKMYGNWQSFVMAPKITHVEQLPNQQLITFSKENLSLGVWIDGYLFLEFREIPCSDWLRRLSSIIAVSDTRFMTVTGMYENEGGIHTWTQDENHWISEEYFQPPPETRVQRLFVRPDGTLLIFIDRQFYEIMAWSEHFKNWLSIPQMDFLFWNFGGILPDGRLYSSRGFSSSRGIQEYSLELLTETVSEWKSIVVLSLPKGHIYRCDALLILNDGRLVVASTTLEHIDHNGELTQTLVPRLPIRRGRTELQVIERSIRVFIEQHGEWSSVILGNIDSKLLGMVVQNENKLITWHEDGSIKIWNLYP